MTAIDPIEAVPLSPRAMMRRRAVRHAGFLAGSAILILVLAMALFAPWLAPHDPFAQDLGSRLVPPAWQAGGSWNHILGTDGLGRDYLSRLIYGSRVSLIVGVGTMVISGVIGIALGLVGGYFGGRADQAVMYVINTRLSMPGLLVALAVVSVAGGSLTTIVLVLGFLFWDRYAVVVRTATQQARTEDYVAAAKAAGASAFRILWRELRPNIAHHILVVATLEMALAILAESGLSFLGLGIRPPTPSWGLMIAEGRNFLFAKPFLVTIPGIAIFLTVAAINMVGDGLRDITSPEGRH